MTPEQFVYWLQGFVELSPTRPGEEQWAVIRQHLDTVFTPETAAAKARQDREASIASKRERCKELVKALYNSEVYSLQQRKEMREEYKKLKEELLVWDTRAFRTVRPLGRIC